jgi:hypothetical protein
MLSFVAWNARDKPGHDARRHGASTMRLQAAGKPDSVNGGFGVGGMSGGIGCSVDSLNQKSSS